MRIGAPENSRLPPSVRFESEEEGKQRYRTEKYHSLGCDCLLHELHIALHRLRQLGIDFVRDRHHIR
jgi:hypothetical protein